MSKKNKTVTRDVGDAPLEEGDNDVTVTDVPYDDVEPAVTVQEDATPIAVIASAEDERYVAIVPRKTIASCRIGPKYYQFLQGHSVKVPKSIVQHLRERGIV